MPQLDVLQPFSRLLHELYRASHELPAEQFQEAVVRLIKPVLRFDSSMWGTGTVREGGALEVHSIHLHEQPWEMIADWQPLNEEDTAVEECARRPGWVMNVHTPTLYAEPRKAAMRDFTRRYSIINGLIVSNQQPELGLANWISIFRGDAEAHFSEAERSLVGAFWPHLVQALTINRLMNLDRLYAAPQGPRTSLAIVDRKGVVYHSEPAFPELLRAQWSQWRGAALPPALVEAMTVAPGREYRGTRIAITFHAASDLFFVRARELTAADRLSPRKREIARQFAAGRSYKEIARQLSISPATVRNYLQDIYRNLDITDKAQLATLFSQLR